MCTGQQGSVSTVPGEIEVEHMSEKHAMTLSNHHNERKIVQETPI